MYRYWYYMSGTLDPVTECERRTNIAILPSCMLIILLSENSISFKNMRNLAFWADLYDDYDSSKASKIIEVTDSNAYRVLNNILHEGYVYDDTDFNSYKRIETVSTSVTVDVNDYSVHFICECGLRENYKIMLSAEVRNSEKVICNIDFEISDIGDMIECLKYLAR